MNRFFHTVGRTAWEATTTAAWIVVALVGVGVAAHLAKNLVLHGWNLVS